jgi:4-hydroxyacetophenone monooxygenase
MTVVDQPVVSSSPSPFVHEVRPVTKSDEFIRRALEHAELPPLLPALACLTGDLSLLQPHLMTDPLLMQAPQGGLMPEQQSEIRELALTAIARYRDGGSQPAPAPTDADLLRILEYTAGGVPMADYLGLLEEELAYRGEDRRAPDWQRSQLAPDRDFSVVIVGAGMSGILAAHRLGQAGVSYTILDKNADVGGTWHESVYPGCRVDNPSHNYSYSFAQKHDWPFHFSSQPVLQSYFAECADAFGVTPNIRFRSTVLGAIWNEATETWTVRYRDGDGREQSITANAVVSAVGQLNRPAWPAIDGIDGFRGEYFHSAEWRHDIDLTGKKVAVIGTGCSAAQFLPEIVDRVGSVTVFQRTPNWLAPTEDYHHPVEPELTWLFDHLPTYSELNRFLIFWKMGDAGIETVRVNPEFAANSDGGSVNELSELARQLLSDHIRQEFADRPDLIEHQVPNYPPGAKRTVRDNGSWTNALKHEHTRVVTTPIASIAPTGIALTDGTHVDADIIIYATGYQASKFLTPMQVTGRDGVDLHAQWSGDARAYLGVAIPNFPNFWCLYGPNTNIVVNGSIIYFSECGVRYILGLVKLLMATGASSIDIRSAVHDEFNEACDAENRNMAWGWSKVSSWYKNEHGRVAQNWPFTLLDYWKRTMRPNPDEYVLRSL